MTVIPFAIQCTIPERELLALKYSVGGSMSTVCVSKVPGFQYYLKIYPSGRNDDCRGQTMIGLCLVLLDVKKLKADYTYSIESANYSLKAQYAFENTGAYIHSIGFTEDFFKPEKKFIVDGKCTLKINGTFEYETGNINVEQQKWDGGELGNGLWEEEDSKDFTIVVDGKEIKVHKLFLRIRSDVFKAMLNPETKESIENKVEITDFTFDVVETALKMIYHCNFVSSLSSNQMMSLLQFFDKYQISMLKDKVELVLINQISAATVCRLTNVSIISNSINLKKKCMEFLMESLASKTPLCDYEILDNDVLKKVVQDMAYQTVQIR